MQVQLGYCQVIQMLLGPSFTLDSGPVKDTENRCNTEIRGFTFQNVQSKILTNSAKMSKRDDGYPRMF